MASVGDIYQTRLLYKDYTGEEMVFRIYWEVVTAGSITAVAVNNALDTFFEDDMRDIMSSDTTITQHQTVNGMDNSDNEEEAVSLAGTSVTSGHQLPYLSAAIRIPRQTPGQRHAYHHIGGVVPALDSDQKWSSTMLDAIKALGTDLAEEKSIGGGLVKPVQLSGGFKLTVSPTRRRYLDVGAQVSTWPLALDRRKVYGWVSAT